MLRVSYVIHQPDGEMYALETTDDLQRVTGIAGPLPQSMLDEGNPNDKDWDFETEDLEWAQTEDAHGNFRYAP